MTRFPFLEHIGVVLNERRPGASKCTLEVVPHHFNSSGVVHGGVAYTMADTAMAAALMSELEPGERCATIETAMRYFKPIAGGFVTCTAQLIHRGKSLAYLEASVYVESALVAKAGGHFAIFTPPRRSRA